MLIAVLAAAPATAKTVGTPRDVVDTIVIHAIAGPICEDGRVVFTSGAGDAASWKSFFDQHQVLGIHYIIDRQGTVVTGIREDQVANHAKGNNATSIGIELVNGGDGKDPYPARQIDALVEQLKQIGVRWTIAPERIVTHSAVDNRYFECAGKTVKLKQDPGPLFPLADVRRRASEQ